MQCTSRGKTKPNWKSFQFFFRPIPSLIIHFARRGGFVNQLYFVRNISNKLCYAPLSLSIFPSVMDTPILYVCTCLWKGCNLSKDKVNPFAVLQWDGNQRNENLKKYDEMLRDGCGIWRASTSRESKAGRLGLRRMRWYRYGWCGWMAWQNAASHSQHLLLTFSPSSQPASLASS